MRHFELDVPNKNIHFALDQNKYSYLKQIFENLNTYYCLKCGTKLEYEYYNFETLGKYHCPKCDFKWEQPEVIGSNLDLEKGTLTLEEEKVNIGGDMLFNAYNTLASYTFLKEIGLEKLDIIKGINKWNHTHNIEFIKMINNIKP